MLYIHTAPIISLYMICCMVHAVAQLAEALRYKPEARSFDSR